jgi:VIT1/CCC1 family predicted Fe2+/Mn2+ transporter
MHAINRQDFINVSASAALFAVVLGVGHTDSLALNKHLVVRSPEHVTIIISAIAAILGAILVILLYVFRTP